MQSEFLPVTENERKLYFFTKATHDFENSLEITIQLVALIITQGKELPQVIDILKHTSTMLDINYLQFYNFNGISHHKQSRRKLLYISA